MKDGFVKVAAASSSISVGNVDYNAESIIDLIDRADKKGVKILVFPELSITGYTVGDLLMQRALIDGALRALKRVVESTKDKDMLVFVGLPYMHNSKLYNTAIAINKAHILAVIPKSNIPAYNEFYETRWFSSSPENVEETTILGERVPFGNKILFSSDTLSQLVVGAEICEDMWVPVPPSVNLALSGATVIVNLSASNELIGKDEYRKSLVKAHSARTISGYIYSNVSNGESTTDMVFTGANMIAENGALLSYNDFCSDDMTITEIDVEKIVRARARANTFKYQSSGCIRIPFSIGYSETELTRTFNPYPFIPQGESSSERLGKILTLQAMGLKRRLEHVKAKSAVVGLSGGLDSTLALLVTAKAYEMLSWPKSEILAITMPCFGTTKRTRSNAELLASSLGVSFKEVDIKKSVIQHFEDIGQSLDDHSVTYENGQARERTQVLMDIANQRGGIVIGTGDMSELALGWATFNGDHASMYGVNAGIPKTLVRYLVEFVRDNASESVSSVLSDILLTPVSPELLPAKDGEISQVTEDIVGPYELHDFYLYYMIRHGFNPEKIYRLAIVAFDKKYDNKTIKKWLVTFLRRFFSQQFKRNFLPDGPKIGTVSLSPRSDWRMPSDASGELWIKEAECLEV